MRYSTGTRFTDHHYIFKSYQIFLLPRRSLAVGCFEDMSPFAASNFDSPLAAQSDEAGNNSECHFLHQFLQRSVANWKRVNHWWRLPVLLQFKWIFSALQMPVLQGADGPALRIKGRTRNQCGDWGSYHWAQLLCLTFLRYPNMIF